MATDEQVRLTPEELERLKAAYLNLQKRLDALDQTEAGGSEDAPREKSLYDNTTRMALSFGDDEGRKEALTNLGYKAVKQNVHGDTIAQGQDGGWYKDADRFWGNPINWAESGFGKALPMIGGTAGGIAGIPLIGAGPFAGAAVGGGFGEALRQAAGRSMGTYKGSNWQSLGDTGFESLLNFGGAAAQPGIDDIVKAIGRTKAGQYASNKIIEPMKEKGAEALSKAASVMTGIPSWINIRNIQRPAEMELAERLGTEATNRAAAQGAAELSAVNEEARQASIAARNKFKREFGEKVTGTGEQVKKLMGVIDELAPNENGHGRLTNVGETRLRNKVNDGLTTPVETRPEVLSTPIRPGMVPESPVLDGKKIMGESDPFVTPVKITPEEVKWTDPSKQEYFTPVEVIPEKVEFTNASKQEFYDPLNPLWKTQPMTTILEAVKRTPPKINPQKPLTTTLEAIERTPSKVVKDGKTIDWTRIKPGIWTDAAEQVWEPRQTVREPFAKYGDIQDFADMLKTQIDSWPKDKLAGNKVPGKNTQAAQRLIYGKSKEILHRASPALRAADQAMEAHAADMATLRSLAKPQRAETFVNALFNENRSAINKAAARRLPMSYDNMLDAAASKRYRTLTNNRNWANIRNHAGRFALGTAIGGVGAYTNNPWLEVLGFGGAIASRPSVAKHALRGLSKIPGRVGFGLRLGEYGAADEILDRVGNINGWERLLEGDDK